MLPTMTAAPTELPGARGYSVPRAFPWRKAPFQGKLAPAIEYDEVDQVLLQLIHSVYIS